MQLVTKGAQNPRRGCFHQSTVIQHPVLHRGASCGLSTPRLNVFFQTAALGHFSPCFLKQHLHLACLAAGESEL